MPRFETPTDRLKEVSRRLSSKSIEPKPGVQRGNSHEWNNSTYMNLCNSECFFCGDWTYNYLTRLDESKNFHPDNLVSECAHCKKLRGERTIQQYKELADGTV